MTSRESRTLLGLSTGVVAVLTTIALRHWFEGAFPTAALVLLFALLVGPCLVIVADVLHAKLSTLAIDVVVLGVFFGPAGLSLHLGGGPPALSILYLAIPLLGAVCAVAAALLSWRKSAAAKRPT